MCQLALCGSEGRKEHPLISHLQTGIMFELGEGRKDCVYLYKEIKEKKIERRGKLYYGRQLGMKELR